MLKLRILASELRDNADATREPAVYAIFLNTLIPPITAMLLETGPPVVFFREPPEQVHTICGDTLRENMLMNRLCT